MITSTKLYVLVVILSIKDNISFLEHFKQAFRKGLSEIKTQPKFNNLDYMTDPTFGNIDRLFVLSSKAGENGHAKNSFGKYYIPLVKIEDFNALIDNKPIFEPPIKTKKKCMKNLLKCQKTTSIQQESY